MAILYDKIGQRYSAVRKADPEIERQIFHFLSGAESILNIGAGSGSYEPDNIPVVGVEPSIQMIRQRSRGAAPVVQATAESLPFLDNAFSHTMTILSMHHWHQRNWAFNEIKRVTSKRFVAVTWVPEAPPFWLTKDYFPKVYELDQAVFPALSELEIAFSGAQFYPLMIPADCQDGFTAAFWSRPNYYLAPLVREGMSTFQRIGDLSEGLGRLQKDLDSGVWHARYGHLLKYGSLDVGYRIMVWEMA